LKRPFMQTTIIGLTIADLDVKI